MTTIPKRPTSYITSLTQHALIGWRALSGAGERIAAEGASSKGNSETENEADSCTPGGLGHSSETHLAGQTERPASSQRERSQEAGHMWHGRKVGLKTEEMATWHTNKLDGATASTILTQKELLALRYLRMLNLGNEVHSSCQKMTCWPKLNQDAWISAMIWKPNTSQSRFYQSSLCIALTLWSQLRPWANMQCTTVRVCNEPQPHFDYCWMQGVVLLETLRCSGGLPMQKQDLRQRNDMSSQAAHIWNSQL